jgi:hypothetical protein
MKTFQSRLSFVVMTFLAFIGLHFLLFNWVSTGPNTDLSLGWLALHRHGFEWTIGEVRPPRRRGSNSSSLAPGHYAPPSHSRRLLYQVVI